MINLLFESLPDSITVHGKDYKINVDFKYWVELSEVLNDAECNKEYLNNVLLNIFCDEIPEEFNNDVFLAIKAFLVGNIEVKKSFEDKEKKISSPKIFDYKIDCEYFIAAFQQHYQINLLEEDMHWFRFLALFRGLGECELKQRMYYRGIDLFSIKDKKERARIRKIQYELRLDKVEVSDEIIAQILW